MQAADQIRYLNRVAGWWSIGLLYAEAIAAKINTLAAAAAPGRAITQPLRS